MAWCRRLPKSRRRIRDDGIRLRADGGVGKGPQQRYRLGAKWVRCDIDAQNSDCPRRLLRESRSAKRPCKKQKAASMAWRRSPIKTTVAHEEQVVSFFGERRWCDLPQANRT